MQRRLIMLQISHVAYSVCMFVLCTWVSPAKTDEPIEIPLGGGMGYSRGLKKSCIKWGRDFSRPERANFEGCAHWKNIWSLCCGMCSKRDHWTLCDCCSRLQCSRLAVVALHCPREKSPCDAALFDHLLCFITTARRPSQVSSAAHDRHKFIPLSAHIVYNTYTAMRQLRLFCINFSSELCFEIRWALSRPSRRCYTPTAISWPSSWHWLLSSVSVSKIAVLCTTVEQI